jgi:hypothetical protein
MPKGFIGKNVLGTYARKQLSKLPQMSKNGGVEKINN